MIEDPTDKHSREQVWLAVNKTNERVSSIEAQVTGLGATMSTVAESIRRIEARDNKPTNLLGLGMFALALVAATGSFVVLHTSPVSQKTDANEDRMDQLVGVLLDDRNTNAERHILESGKLGAIEARLAAQEAKADALVAQQLNDIEQRGYGKAVDDMLKNWVNKIDNIGLRGQNK
jgi:septal ring factor EnvC (AmiA/AmiB activator)